MCKDISRGFEPRKLSEYRHARHHSKEKKSCYSGVEPVYCPPKHAFQPFGFKLILNRIKYENLPFNIFKKILSFF